MLDSDKDPANEVITYYVGKTTSADEDGDENRPSSSTNGVNPADITACTLFKARRFFLTYLNKSWIFNFLIQWRETLLWLHHVSQQVP